MKSAGKRLQTKYRRLKLKVDSNQEICENHYLLTVKLPDNPKINVIPGQFFHVICDPDGIEKKGYQLTLRRPFSVHRINSSRIEFLYRVVGKGTEILSQIKAGILLDAIGPSGNGFEIGNKPRAIVVAGGIGIAPLMALIEKLCYQKKEVHLYFGALNKEQLRIVVKPRRKGNTCIVEAIESEFNNVGVKNVRISTDNGSVGYKGLVTELLADDLRKGLAFQKDTIIYTCGPHNMMKTVAKIAGDNKIRCQVLLEERMACGIGACFSCVCDVIGPEGTPVKKRVCRDGPVFNAAEIIWKN